MALAYDSNGFYLAFSGGKDSQTLYHVAKLAGVKYEAYFALTTLDPPELVNFVRTYYPDVTIVRPELTFTHLCIKKKALPTQFMRFCCAALKETKGIGRVTLTGIRKQESVKRSKRNEAETIATKEKRFSGTFEQLDEFTRTKETDAQCIGGRDKIVINPIIEWTTADVWYFLNDVVKVQHCSLYDKGWRRIGCLFCPMASTKEIIRQGKEYPKYKDSIIRTIHRLRDGGYMSDYMDLTDQEIFDWWISKKPIKQWYSEQKKQLQLF